MNGLTAQYVEKTIEEWRKLAEEKISQSHNPGPAYEAGRLLGQGEGIRICAEQLQISLRLAQTDESRGVEEVAP